MRLFRTIAFTVIILAVVVALIVMQSRQREDQSGSPSTAQQRDGEVSLQGDSPTARALAQAKEEGRPVWLLIHAEHCQPCAVMEKTYEQIEPEFEGKVVFLSADFDDPKEGDLMDFFKVRFVPTSVFMDASGKMDTRVGEIPPNQMRKILTDLQKN